MRTIVRIALLLVFLAGSGTALFAVGKQDMPKSVGMPESAANGAKTAVLITPELTITSARTAVLIMDYQNEIVNMLPENVRVPLLDRASTILQKARQAHLPIVYVVVRFREGYPEINPRNKLFSSLKESGRLREGTSGSEIHDRVAPQPQDIVVAKRRVGAFSTTDLDTILRAKNINTLVLFGISTSGVVLSTLRWAADLDYSLVVISDVCADQDAEVNRVLMDKVFPRQATVVTTREFLNAIGAKDVR
ncbi:MAG TPA: cysteine hydrolase [Nitrospirota bacterium]|nr:cysteine hydrolase [Nitrospirota bacterium]